MKVKPIWKLFALGCMTFVFFVTLSACSGDSKDAASTTSPFSSLKQAASYAGAILSKPYPKFDGTLVDSNGAAFNMAEQTKGAVTMVFFGYTNCPDACPTIMGTLASAKNQVSPDVAKNVKVLFITVDPQRDTTKVLKDWLGKIDISFIGLTGSANQLKAVEVAYGIPPEVIDKATPEQLDYFVDHFAGVFVYSPDNYAHLLYPAQGVSASQWASDIAKLAKQGFKQP